MEHQKDMDFLGAVRRRWLLVVIVTVLAAVAGYGASNAMSPVYQGRSSLLVGDFDNGEVSYNEIEAMQSLAATYADIGRRAPVLTRAAQDLGLRNGWRGLSKAVHIRVAEESPQVIEITAEGSSAPWARAVAGAVSSSLVRYVDRTSGGTNFVSPQLRQLERSIERGQKKAEALLEQQRKLGDAAPPSLDAQIQKIQDQVSAWRSNYASFKQLSSSSSHVAVRALDPASADPDPISPNTRFNTVMAGFLGFLLGLAAVYLLETRRLRRGPGLVEDHDPDSPLILPPGVARVNGHANGRDRIAGHSTSGLEHHEGEAR